MTEEAKKKSGLTESQLVRFETIIKNMESYLKANPDVVTFISRETGLSNKQILADSKYGSGPTLTISDIPQLLFGAYVDDRFGEPEIQIDVGTIKQLEDYDSDDELFQYIILAIVQTVLHEYTYYGDIKTNGKITGQEGPFKDKNGEPIAKQPIKVSFNKHRGIDVDERVFGYSVFITYDSDKKTWHYEKEELQNLKKANNVDKLHKGKKFESDSWSIDRIDQTFNSEHEDGNRDK